MTDTLRHLVEERITDIERRKKAGDVLNKSDQAYLDQYRILRCRESFSLYVRYMMEESPLYPFQEYAVDRVEYNLKIKNGRIFLRLPPQSGKSTILYFAITWLFGVFPDHRIAYATYSDDRAREATEDIKRIMRSEKYRRIFDTRILSSIEEERIVKNMARTNKETQLIFNILNSKRGGGFKGTSVHKFLTGFSPNVIIIDDYHTDYTQAESQRMRDRVYAWYKSVVIARAQIKTGLIVLGAVTQWNEDDLVGRITKNEKVFRHITERLIYEHVVFPAEYWKDDREARPYDTRKIGDFLIPEKISFYVEAKYDTDPQALLIWWCVYQQNPIVQDGDIFKAEWEKHYRVLPDHHMFKMIVVDCSLKNTAVSDEAAISVFIYWGGRFLSMVDWTARRMGYVETRGVVLDYVRNKHPDYNVLIIENKANGPALTDDLRDMGIANIEEFDPGEKSKRARAFLATPTCAAGEFLLPDTSVRPDVMQVIDQMRKFKGGDKDKDDIVDTIIMAILYRNQRLLHMIINARPKAIQFKPPEIEALQARMLSSHSNRGNNLNRARAWAKLFGQNRGN